MGGFSFVATTWFKLRNQQRKNQIKPDLRVAEFSQTKTCILPHTSKHNPLHIPTPSHFSLLNISIHSNEKHGVCCKTSLQHTAESFRMICSVREALRKSHTDTTEDWDRWKQRIRPLRSFKLIYMCVFSLSFLSLSQQSHPLPSK